jgi:thiol-disulfide isomerase/thioredoxin
MFMITASIVTVGLFTQTPKAWQDTQLDNTDRQAMEQLVSYAPPHIPTDATWIIPENESKDSSKPTTNPTWADFLGNVVVVQSWSNTDARSRQIIGATNKAIARTTTPEDVVLIQIHTPKGIPSLNKYQSKYPIQAPTIIDSTGELCNAFGFYTDPTNVVIDRNGAVQYVGLGMKGLIDAVDSLLATPYNHKVKVEQFTPSEVQAESPVQYPIFSDKFGRATNWQGKQAPEFYIEEWLSPPVDVQNRVRVIEFWATWCAPCRKSIPHLNEWNKHFDDAVAFVSVSNESKSKVEEFMKNTPMEYGVAVDTKAKMKNTISCSAIPLALVISSDGVVRWQGNPHRLSRKTIQQVLSADMGETVLTTRGRWDLSETAKPKK